MSYSSVDYISSKNSMMHHEGPVSENSYVDPRISLSCEWFVDAYTGGHAGRLWLVHVSQPLIYSSPRPARDTSPGCVSLRKPAVIILASHTNPKPELGSVYEYREGGDGGWLVGFSV